MTLRVRRLIFALFAVSALLSVDVAGGAIVPWNVDSAQSFVRLAIPDQTVVLDGTTALLRLRGANNAAWSDSNGARAFVDGTIATDLQGNSIQFIGGGHSLVALESGSYRPNPALWDPNASNADNPDGQYTGTDGAAAAFGAKARSSLTLPLDLFYLALRDVVFDANSGSILMASTPGGFTFAGATNTFGIQSAAADIDGLAAQIVGQVVPDLFHSPLSELYGQNTLGGGIQLFTAFGTELTLNINVPLEIEIEGVPLQVIATGRIVAYSIPEPSSVLLAGFGICGLCWAGRRRLRRAER